jgi:hypothetical protein
MLENGRAYDTWQIALQRMHSGFRRRPTHHRHDSCSLVRRLRVERPVFGGAGGVPLRGSYRLTSEARVSIVVTRGGRIVKRFRPVTRPAGRTFRFSLPARGLARGDYRVLLRAVSGEDQIAATVTARRL